MGNISKICSFGFMAVFFLGIGRNLYSLYTLWSLDLDLIDVTYSSQQILWLLLVLFLAIFCHYFAKVLKNET